MKRTVTIEFEIDPRKYLKADDGIAVPYPDTDASVITITKAILSGDADWPEGCVATIITDTAVTTMDLA